MADDANGGMVKKALFEKRYPLWVLLLITAVYAVGFEVVLYRITGSFMW